MFSFSVSFTYYMVELDFAMEIGTGLARRN